MRADYKLKFKTILEKFDIKKCYYLECLNWSRINIEYKTTKSNNNKMENEMKIIRILKKSGDTHIHTHNEI